MEREAPRVRQAAYGIGLAFGLVAGMVGVAQWVLTEQDLTERWNAFLAIRRRSPEFFDATNVSRGTTFDWLGTATQAAAVMLILYLIAAFTATWALRRRRDGLVAAWIAAAVSAAVYVAATIVALVTSPAPEFTEGVLPCEVPLGLAFLCLVVLLTPLGTGLGMRTGAFFSRNRQAP